MIFKSLGKYIRDFFYLLVGDPNIPTGDPGVCYIPEEKEKRLNWNVDYFAQINVEELKPQDVVIFRISDDVELNAAELGKVKEALERKAKMYGINNKVMVLYKLDMGILKK